MKGLRTAVCLAAILAIGGCAGGGLESPKPPAMNPALCRAAYMSLQSNGGFKAWQGLGPVRAKAVLSIHEPGAQEYVTAVGLTIDLAGGVLEASGQTATGAWQARAGIDGTYTLSGEGLPGEPARQEQIGKALATILHRLRGPMNLLLGSDRPAGASREADVDGVEVVRLPVAGGAFDAKAYYFDKADRRLAFLTAGADAPGGKGAVTLYEYRTFRGGLAFPSRLRLIRVGTNVLVGRQGDDLLLDVTFSHVQL
ncbi:MAG: hypothetical protein NTV86_09685 [Planctomycetota bacterium]|nr:hypothetical protein [Planctomycetota bacterium]